MHRDRPPAIFLLRPQCAAAISLVLWGCSGNSIGVADGAADEAADEGSGDTFATAGFGTTGFGTDSLSGLDTFGDDDTGRGDTPWGDTTWGDTTWGGTEGVDCEVIELGSAIGAEVLAGTLDERAFGVTLICNPQVGVADVAARWTPPTLGPYTIRVASDSFEPVVGVTADYCGADPFGCDINCDPGMTGLVVSGWQDPLRIFVEAADGGSGAFSLSVEAGATLTCG